MSHLLIAYFVRTLYKIYLCYVNELMVISRRVMPRPKERPDKKSWKCLKRRKEKLLLLHVGPIYEIDSQEKDRSM